MKIHNLLFSSLLPLSGLAPAAFAAPPPPPLGLAMVANSGTSVTLAWYRSLEPGVTAYRLYTGSTRDGVFAPLATVTGLTATHENLIPGATCFYKVAASSADGEGKPSAATPGFTFVPCPGAPFPVKVAKNMCVSLGATIVSKQVPLSGKLANLVDGSDATGCRLRKACDLRIRLNPDVAIADAAYLLLNFRTDCSRAEMSNDHFARTLRNYTVTESLDSTNGEDGTWQELVTGTNALLDGVIVIPNHRPKWIGVRSAYNASEQPPAATDRRMMPSDLFLCRLDVFRAPPAGYRNDYWLFAGDSLVVQDLPGGGDKERSAWFSDLVRQQHPDRYPIVVHLGRGGTMLKDTLPHVRQSLPALSPPNGTDTPTATIVCWETGFNDVGVGGSLGVGAQLIKRYEAALELCRDNGLVMVPVRIEFATTYLNPETLEPAKGTVFYNTLAVNLGGVDVFCRNATPYACDPATQLPYADYWTCTRQNHATILGKDGVHHTKAGSDAINRLWADVAGKMVYAKQP